ncbi:mitochondrial import inner membrane translocase subunit Tim10 B [Polymixia lowei]
MEPDQQLRNLRDFLLVYNRMTEICFQRCSSNFNYRSLTMDEEHCADSCAGKLIRSNHRLMGTYVQLMPRMVQRRLEEMESKVAENAKAAEAAGAGAVGGSGAAAPTIAEGLPTAEPLIAPSPSPQIPALISPVVTDVGQVQMPSVPGKATDNLALSPVLGEAVVRPELSGSISKSSGLDNPVELGPATFKSTAAPLATESKMAAATPLTPATETVNPSALNKADNGPAYKTVSLESPFNIREPLPSLSGPQTETRNSVPVSVKPMSMSVPLSEDVSTIAAPAVSKATETLTVRERAPEVSSLSGK